MADTKVKPSPRPCLYDELVLLSDFPSLKSYIAMVTKPAKDSTTMQHLTQLNLSLIAIGTIQEMPSMYTHIGEVLDRITEDVIEANASP
jgi:hypothetical protein